MEIITGVERRRRWRIDNKLRIVAEAQSQGAIVSHVARRHHISRGLLSNWRQQVRRGALTDGTCLRVGADVGLAALRRIITAVRR